LSDENQRKKYDFIYKTISNDTFEVVNLTEINNLNDQKLKIKPGEFKYPIYINITNEKKEKIDYEDTFKSTYSNYEFRLGDKWEYEVMEMKNIENNLSKFQTNDKFFIDV